MFSGSIGSMTHRLLVSFGHIGTEPGGGDWSFATLIVGRSSMDKDRIVGSAKEFAGKVESTVGGIAGDAKTEASGRVREATGSAQDLYGQARESVSQVADAAAETATVARQTASSFERSLRNTIETQPYTAVFVALGLGWLVGRMHRPQ